VKRIREAPHESRISLAFNPGYASTTLADEPQPYEERSMKALVVTVIAVLATTVAAIAQAVPDLKGTWSGQWRTVIYGTNPHHPGPGTPADAPRIREITFTMEIEGQDGRLLWGKSWSNPDRKEPFAATIAPDGKIIGSDMDGSLTMSIAAPDRLDACYTHTALSPSKSIVASCGALQRASR